MDDQKDGQDMNHSSIGIQPLGQIPVGFSPTRTRKQNKPDGTQSQRSIWCQIHVTAVYPMCFIIYSTEAFQGASSHAITQNLLQQWWQLSGYSCQSGSRVYIQVACTSSPPRTPTAGRWQRREGSEGWLVSL